jgi:hypothetical protein
VGTIRKPVSNLSVFQIYPVFGSSVFGSPLYSGHLWTEIIVFLGKPGFQQAWFSNCSLLPIFYSCLFVIFASILAKLSTFKGSVV